MLNPSRAPSYPSAYSDTLLTFGICGRPSASGVLMPLPGWLWVPIEVGVREALVELASSLVATLLSSLDLAGELPGVLFDGLEGVRFSVTVVEED